MENAACARDGTGYNRRAAWAGLIPVWFVNLPQGGSGS